MTGSGTQSEPYIVDTFADFQTAVSTSGAFVTLAADILSEISNPISIVCTEIDGAGFSLTISPQSRGNAPLVFVSSALSINNLSLILNVVLNSVPAIIGNYSNNTQFTDCFIKFNASGSHSTPNFNSCKFIRCEITIDGGEFSTGTPPISPTYIEDSCVILKNATISTETFLLVDSGNNATCSNCYLAIDNSVACNAVRLAVPDASGTALYAYDVDIPLYGNGWTSCTTAQIKDSDFIDSAGLEGWNVNEDENNGYPYIIKRPEPEPIPVIVNIPKICIYDADTPQNGFDNNGLAVLCPISCTIHEELNGKYVLTMEHPIDSAGIWRTINAFNHIKALGQIFDIKSVVHNYNGNSGKITVYAEHVFYKQNDPWIFPGNTVSGNTANALLASIQNAADHMVFPGSVDYVFSYNSDIDITSGYSREITEGCTLADAIIGSDGVLGTFGGELYRDNFYFSIMKKLENCQENAFEIRVGLNLKGIKRTVDVETFCSYFRAYDHLGQWFAISFTASSYAGLPIQNSIVRSQNFSYDTDDPDVSMGNLEREGDFYWKEHFMPNISYEVDLEDVKTNPDFAFLENHFRFKVGDYGRIYDQRLGGSLQLRITETEKDAITGKTTKVIFGDVQGFVKESSSVPVPAFPSIPIVTLYYLDDDNKRTGATEYYSSFESARDKLKEGGFRNRPFFDVVVATGVTAIPDNAFEGCEKIVSVSLPDGITSIGQRAFSSCELIEEMQIPETVKAIGSAAFRGCDALKKVNIPADISIINGSAFNHTGIEEITIPKNVELIGDAAFRDCEKLRNVVFSTDSKCNEIAYEAFAGCDSLENIAIPSSVENIGKKEIAGLMHYYAFNRVTNVYINKPENSIEGAPWGAASVHWTG